jgi:hypothetical protein
MKLRRLLQVLVGVVVASVAVGSLLLANPSWRGDPEPVATIVYPRESSPEAAFWPLNNCRIWSIRHLDPASNAKTLWLRARVVRRDLKEGSLPAILPTEIQKADCDHELSAGGVGPGSGTLDVPVSVSVQLIDLREIGLANEKRPLRLLMNLTVGGTGTTLNGERGVLEGERVAGWCTPTTSEWKNGELHLQNFYLADEKRYYIYDIFLVQGDLN